MSDLTNFNINDFNNFLTKANETISCGPSCMEQQQSQQLFTAKKEYITYKQGDSGYNEYIDKELQNNAETIASSYQTKFNKSADTVKTNIQIYDGLLINFNNVVDLYKKYKKENNDLEKKLKIKSSDTLTNDRKNYYEDQGVNRLKMYYYFLLFIYVFIVFIFLLSVFLVKTDVKLSIRLLILFLLIIYPFVSYWIFNFLQNFFLRVNSYFPNNVYRNL